MSRLAPQVELSNALGMEFDQFRTDNAGVLTPKVAEMFQQYSDSAVISRVTPSTIHATYQMLMMFKASNGTELLETPDIATDNPSETMSMLARTLLSSRLRGDDINTIYEELPLDGNPVPDGPKETKSYPVASTTAGFCADADPMFAGALARLNMDGDLRSFSEDFTGNLSIFMDGDTPLFLKKYESEVNALSLRHFISGGLWFPAGTIVSLETTGEQDWQPEDYEGEAGFLDFGESTDPDVLHDVDDELGNGSYVRVLGANCIKGVRPLRLSPWANSDADTRMLYGYSFKADHVIGSRQKIAQYSLQQFVDGIERFMYECT